LPGAGFDLYIFWLYFSFRGRVSRPAAVFNILILAVTHAAISRWPLTLGNRLHVASDGLGNNYLTGGEPILPSFMGAVTLIIVALLAAPILVKRCHDYDSPGIEAAIIAALVALVGVGQLLFISLPPESIAALPPDMLDALQWVADHQRYLWTGGLAASSNFWLRPGTPGPNRYGNPPGTEDEPASPAGPADPGAPRT